MTGVVLVDDHVEFLAKEYLRDYVARGGAAVKVVVGDDDARFRFHAGLSRVAADDGYVYASVDATDTRVHLVDQLWFTIAAQIDFAEMAAALVTTAYRAADAPTSRAIGLTVADVAAHYHLDAAELHRSVRRRLEADVLGDTRLPRELRLAVFRLAQHQLGTGDVDDHEAAALGAWLTGGLRRVSEVRSSQLYQRVTRANGHALLVGLPGLVARCGHNGLVVDIDLGRLGVDRRPPADAQHGVYYTKPAVLDAYEVIRQLIDATDELQSALVCVAAGPELVADEVRGFPAYSALWLRLVDEVRDRDRVNPFASMVRITER